MKYCVFRMKLYPYVDYYTLLCHTWLHDITQFSSLRINPTVKEGKY